VDCHCTRRSFMKGGALALLGLGAIPRFLVRAAYAQGGATRPKILIAVFQRGAVDGLKHRHRAAGRQPGQPRSRRLLRIASVHGRAEADLG